MPLSKKELYDNVCIFSCFCFACPLLWPRDADAMSILGDLLHTFWGGDRSGHASVLHSAGLLRDVARWNCDSIACAFRVL